tara:strand:- start:469 stop:648 length:180 start_codon:yes stop_codon:yes gene_type:complete
MRTLIVTVVIVAGLSGCTGTGVPEECEGISKTEIGGKTYYVTKGGGVIPAYCTKYATEK